MTEHVECLYCGTTMDPVFNEKLYNFKCPGCSMYTYKPGKLKIELTRCQIETARHIISHNVSGSSYETLETVQEILRELRTAIEKGE